MKDRALQGLLKASPEKRYKSFLATAADTEEIWFLSSEDGEVMLEADGYIHLLVWPRKEFAEMFRQDGEEAASVEVHEFIEQCETQEDIRFMVFPNDKDCYIVDAEKLAEDLNAALEEVE